MSKDCEAKPILITEFGKRWIKDGMFYMEAKSLLKPLLVMLPEALARKISTENAAILRDNVVMLGKRLSAIALAGCLAGEVLAITRVI